MEIKQYDRVVLKDGDYAYIVEIFGDGKDLLADVDRKGGTETEWIKPESIDKIVD